MRLFAALAVGLLLVSPALPDQTPEAGSTLEPYRLAPRVGIWVDGLEGRMETTGRIRLSDKVEPGSYQFGVIQDRALEEGRRQLSAAVADLRIDDARVLSEDAEASRRVHALIAALTPHAVRHDQGLYFEVDLALPFRGLSGVLGMILERGVTPEQPYQNGTADEGGATGLVVDAVRLDGADRLAMALLPRIVDEKGRVVYEVTKVDLDLARELGMVAYAREVPSGARNDASSRTGDRPIRVPALSAGGAARTDIVIAAADADRILEAAASSPFLRECRVTVLMPQPPPPPAIVHPHRAPERPPVDPNTLH